MEEKTHSQSCGIFIAEDPHGSGPVQLKLMLFRRSIVYHSHDMKMRYFLYVKAQ